MEWLIIAAIACAALVVWIHKRPSRFSVSRSKVMAARAEDIMPLLIDFNQWQRWSPWAAKDPQAKITIEGPTCGVGAAMHWAGNRKVGYGSMRITAVKVPHRAEYEIIFGKKTEPANLVSFDLESDAEQTKVTWSISGKMDFWGKAFSLVANLDTMIGADYEAGLSNLETLISTTDGGTVSDPEPT